jgi:hypothetical protein
MTFGDRDKIDWGAPCSATRCPHVVLFEFTVLVGTGIC